MVAFFALIAGYSVGSKFKLKTIVYQIGVHFI